MNVVEPLAVNRTTGSIPVDGVSSEADLMRRYAGRTLSAASDRRN
jgi:hypothetical protein